MTGDNLFDRLADLFRSNGPVNWRLGREIAESMAGEHDPVEPWLAEEYRELATTAAMRIASSSPLDPTAATADVRPIDRRTWAGDNVQAFSYLAEPFAEKVTGATPPGSPLQPLGPALLGMQMGAVVGLMSHTVLGQFDIGIPAGSDLALSFVVPNIESFASDNGLDPRQVRLWVAFHEVSYRAEFEVPWVRERFLMLIHRFIEGIEIDPDEISRRMALLQDPAALQRMLDDPSEFSEMLSGEAQQGPLDDVRAFMSVMEGYGDYLVEHAGPGLIPQAPQIRDAIDARRSETTEGEQMLSQALGLDLDHRQYRLGTEFCEEVDRRWGAESLVKLWDGPEMLPTLGELQDVVGWAARVLL